MLSFLSDSSCIFVIFSGRWEFLSNFFMKIEELLQYVWDFQDNSSCGNQKMYYWKRFGYMDDPVC